MAMHDKLVNVLTTGIISVWRDSMEYMYRFDKQYILQKVTAL